MLEHGHPLLLRQNACHGARSPLCMEYGSFVEAINQRAGAACGYDPDRSLRRSLLYSCCSAPVVNLAATRNPPFRIGNSWQSTA